MNPEKESFLRMAKSPIRLDAKDFYPQHQDIQTRKNAAISIVLSNIHTAVKTEVFLKKPSNIAQQKETKLYSQHIWVHLRLKHGMTTPDAEVYLKTSQNFP